MDLPRSKRETFHRSCFKINIIRMHNSQTEDYHASNATGLVDSTRPMVAGFVACWIAYELPDCMKSRALRRPLCSASVISCSRFSGSSSMMQKLTCLVSRLPSLLLLTDSLWMAVESQRGFRYKMEMSLPLHSSCFAAITLATLLPTSPPCTMYPAP